jgi:hypothetical protein
MIDPIRRYMQAGMTSEESQRREVERLLELLGQSTRPARLLAFICAKHFQQQDNLLTEFTIATAVFGRSENKFDSTEDAVVRVEVHRLRKKLREVYAKGPGVDGLQLMLPAGSYVPRFEMAPVAPLADLPDEPESPVLPPLTLRRSAWAWLATIASVIAVAIAIFLLVRSDGPVAAGAPSTAAPATPAPGAAQSEVHLMAGYSGSEVIDNSGVRWTPDRYFRGGGLWSRESGFVRGTSRQFLFRNWRTGVFGYDVPIAPGTYELRLFFTSQNGVGDEPISGFDVVLNGRPLLNSFDVNVSAHGVDVADEKVFRDVSPDVDGFVRLDFKHQISAPTLSAMQITPGTPGRMKPVRILTQPTSFVDHKGQRWRADDYYFNGFQMAGRPRVSGTDDPELFGAERYGHFSYAIPVDVRGRYTVVLHFAEFYFGPQLPGGGGTGSRVFHVFCNGQTLLRSFDIHKEGGGLRLVTRSFPGIEPSAQGKINLTFEPVVNNATVSGIEIIEEPQ